MASTGRRVGAESPSAVVVGEANKQTSQTEPTQMEDAGGGGGDNISTLSEPESRENGPFFQELRAGAAKLRNDSGNQGKPSHQPYQSIVIRTPPHTPLGIEIEERMPLVSRIQLSSPLFGRVQKGDVLVFVDGRSVAELRKGVLMDMLNSGDGEGHELTLLWRPSGQRSASVGKVATPPLRGSEISFTSSRSGQVGSKTGGPEANPPNSPGRSPTPKMSGAAANPTRSGSGKATNPKSFWPEDDSTSGFWPEDDSTSASSGKVKVVDSGAPAVAKGDDKAATRKLVAALVAETNPGKSADELLTAYVGREEELAGHLKKLKRENEKSTGSTGQAESNTSGSGQSTNPAFYGRGPTPTSRGGQRPSMPKVMKSMANVHTNSCEGLEDPAFYGRGPTPTSTGGRRPTMTDRVKSMASVRAIHTNSYEGLEDPAFYGRQPAPKKRSGSMAKLTTNSSAQATNPAFYGRASSRNSIGQESSSASSTSYSINNVNERTVLKEHPQSLSKAGQHFATKESERRIETDAPRYEPPPAAIQHFTSRASASKKPASKEHPQSLSKAGQHFATKESERRSDIEAMKNEPPPAAVEHFTRKANENKRKSLTVATSREAAEPVPIDYFTRIAEAERMEKAKSQKELAHSVAPEAVRYFAAKDEEEKARRLAVAREGHADMPLATRHFQVLALEEEEEKERRDRERSELMPAAVQKFTMAEHEKREKRKAELRKLRETPPDLPMGQAVFTQQMLDERERKRREREEYEARREIPPTVPVAMEYFAEVESQRRQQQEERRQQEEEEEEEEEERSAMRSESSSVTTQSVATQSVAAQHFERQKSIREREIIERREQVKSQYFEKQRALRMRREESMRRESLRME